ncbi:uncharacterized protein SCHCODRAFT_01168846 [Schizophyllum commune H4-8]|nr:uncharacterized protein SCHCODRAFT_01168846 [Schizophyllum commune H4-8]KAI5899373.1 hypothetical protein SCHCODRAFT_01168846 [Schizophyllum commune H4-8]
MGPPTSSRQSASKVTSAKESDVPPPEAALRAGVVKKDLPLVDALRAEGDVMKILDAIWGVLAGAKAEKRNTAQLLVLAAKEHLTHGGCSTANSPAESSLLTAIEDMLRVHHEKLEGRLVAGAPPQVPKLPSVSYAKAAAMPALEFAVSLKSVPAHDPIRKASPAELKQQVETVLRVCDPEHFTPDWYLHGVRRHEPSDRLILQVRKAKDLEKLRLMEQAWVACLASGASVSAPTLQVVIHGASGQFRPQAPGASMQIHHANAHLIPFFENIESVRPLPSSSRRPGTPKSRCSFVLRLRDYRNATARAIASDLIDNNTCVLGKPCQTDLYIPPPLQCYWCQDWGHKSDACPLSDDPTFTS